MSTIQYSWNLTDSLPVRTELFYADRRNEGGQTDTLKPLDAFLECANAPNSEVFLKILS